MQIVRFMTDNPASVLEQIHRQLGPEAVVVSVRRLPARGVARLWQRNGHFEVLAGVPSKTSSDHVARQSAHDGALKTFQSGSAEIDRPAAVRSAAHRWQSVAWLEAMGVLPAHAERLQSQLNALHPAAPASLDAEWEVVNAALAGFWRIPQPLRHGLELETHVFIGPPGSGKTTVLCKWLTLAVLTEARSACVWRLDSSIANTAEFLTVHCEMLGARVERVWPGPSTHADLNFVDLPGAETDDLQALATLRDRLASLSSPQVHLVLNAVYETSVLLAQWRAFAPLKPADLILTHLDEETLRIKLWNLVLGTNCTIRFLSAGQKIPGELLSAVPGLLFPSQIRQ